MDNAKVLELIAERVNEIRDDVSQLKVDSAKNTENLAEHMRRTAAAEKSLETIKQELKPIVTYVAVAKVLVGLLGFLALGVGVIDGILKLIARF